MESNWRKSIKYLEDDNLEITTKDATKKRMPVPPKIKGKHYTNMEFLMNADLNWLTPNFYLSRKYDPQSDDSYFEQCFQACEKLGEGSHGSVIKVKSKDDGLLYAMKISKEPFRHEYDRKLKIREVEHHKALCTHPNIVTLYKAWEEDRFVFMQMEFCQPLLVKEGTPLPESSCWNVLVDMLQALDAIHDSGRVHFDVKVENILLGQDGLYKLSDFGLTQKMNEQIDFLKEGDAKYVAPELIRGRVSEFTAKADIFSLGISILELAGNLDLPNGGDIWSALRQEVFPFKQTKHLSDDLLKLLMRMMASDPANRPSAKEILTVPRVKALAEERRMKTIREFMRMFNTSSLEIVAFFVCCAWFWAITITYTVVIAVSRLPAAIERMQINRTTDITSGTDSSTDSGIESLGAKQNSSCSTSEDSIKSDFGATTSYYAFTSESGSSNFTNSTKSGSDESSAMVIEHESGAHGGPLFSSTPMVIVNDASDPNERSVVKRLKRIKRERLNSEDLEDTASSMDTSEAPTPPRPSPPPSQIFCDWVGITSPSRAIKDASVNRNRLHCPSESLLQYGISPLRLSKACKRQYTAQKRLRRVMVPRNLARSFDDDDEDEESS